MKKPKRTIPIRVAGWFFIVGGPYMFWGRNPEHFGFYLAFFVIGAIYLILSGLIWRIGVLGNEIHMRTFFGRNTYTFQELESVEITENVVDSGKTVKLVPKEVPGEVLKQFIKVPKNCIGYQEFVALLKERNVPGADALW